MTFRLSDRMASFAAVMTMIALVGMVFGLSGPLLSVHLESGGYSGFMIGLNTAPSAIGIVLFTPFVPKVLAKLGTRVFLSACLVVAIAVFIALKLTGDYWSWFALRLAMGGATAGLFAISEAWVNRLGDEGQRGLMFGLYTAILAGGFAMGPLIIQFVGVDGWLPYLTAVVMLAVGWIPLQLSAHRIPELITENAPSLWRYIWAAPAIILVGACFGALESGSFSLFSPMALRAGFGLDTMTAMIAVMAAGYTVMQVPIGLWIDAWAPSKVLVLCSAGAVVASLAIAPLLHTPFIWPTLLIWGGLVSGFYTSGLAVLGDRFKGPDIAGANAAFVASYGMGMTVGPAAIGAGLDVGSTEGFALISAGFCLLALLSAVVIILRERTAVQP